MTEPNDDGQDLQAPRGTHDVLGTEARRWEALIAHFAGTAEAAGFGLVHTPMFEDVRLFRRGIGTDTEVVGKEMYEFTDRGGRQLALRPEGTASIVRAYLQHRPALPFRAWYLTPAFRYEAPQAGRYRQHHQVGIEVLGVADADLDVEILALGDRYLRGLGLEGFTLRLNSLGDPACRPAYLETLRSYLRLHTGSLCEEHAHKIDQNPLRILDCKKPGCRQVSAEAPSLAAVLCEDCASHFARVLEGLDALGIPYLVDPQLVRGLDYYTRTTFEATLALGDGGELTILAGGRYDGLVEVLGGPPTPGIGFGSGIERVLLACDAQEVLQASPAVPFVFVVDATDGRAARSLVAELRNAGIAVDRAYDGRSMKSQFKAADRSGAQLALVVGAAEVEAGTVTIRPLRGEGAQREVPRAELMAEIRAELQLNPGATT